MDWMTVEHAAHFAFRLAQDHRRSVTSASKYTIQRAADGLFEECVAEVAKEYRNVEHRQQLFDALLASLIMNPERYDVIVTPNEYGDFLSDAAYGLVGSIGVGASAAYAFTASHQPSVGVFDPGGGTAPDIAGKGVANPVGALEAYSYLLDHIGEYQKARALRDAIYDAIVAGERTRDLGGSLDTRDFTAQVIKRSVEHLARDSAASA
jgi:isocitrate/isopropylmalate dehydrogenase